MITKEMGIVEIVRKYPQTVPVFQSHGMGCLGCSAARFENVEQGATAGPRQSYFLLGNGR